jgi:hypothetical protein
MDPPSQGIYRARQHSNRRMQTYIHSSCGIRGISLKMDFRETGCEGVNRIEVVTSTVLWPFCELWWICGLHRSCWSTTTIVFHEVTSSLFRQELCVSLLCSQSLATVTHCDLASDRHLIAGLVIQASMWSSLLCYPHERMWRWLMT